MREVLILAGGKGTRLTSEIGELPKALVDVDGRPLLHRQLELAAQHDFRRVILMVHYGASAIRESCGNGEKWGLVIDFVEEAKPSGTAGAVLRALDELADRFVVLYGDTVLNVDLNRIWNWHADKGADATLLVHPNDHPHDSDLVELDEADRVVALHPYPHPTALEAPNLVNGALYVLERSALRGCPIPSGIYDFAKNLFPDMLTSGADLRGYRTREYIKDAGTPNRLAQVVADVRSGKVAKGSLRDHVPAVLVDRDGTINQDAGYITSPEKFQLLPNVANALSRLNKTGYLTVVITNQPVIARGEASEQTLRRIHNRMEMMLGREGGYVDAIYYCPHHPASGFAGERPELKMLCRCRKPEIGLIDQAKADLGISSERSWFVGDSTVDLEAARRAQIRSILVKTGVAGRDGKFPQRPDFECANFAEAVSLILDAWPRMASQAEDIVRSLPRGACIMIGGLARSGKSSLASAIAYTLRRLGDRAVVISLDGWLRDIEDRQTNSSVLDRYDISSIDAFLNSCSTAHSLEIPVYDRYNRKRGGAYRETISPNDFLIVEGVIALNLSLVCKRPIYRIFVDRREEERREDFRRDYVSRGYSLQQIDVIYETRSRDEHPYILESREFADKIVESAFQ